VRENAHVLFVGTFVSLVVGRTPLCTPLLLLLLCTMISECLTVVLCWTLAFYFTALTFKDSSPTKVVQSEYYILPDGDDGEDEPLSF
jgi:hypothetical protein